MQTSSVSDEVLVEQVGRGDRRAAAELVRRHSPRMLGLAQRMLNDRAEAEDVTQDVFLRVWKMAPNWRPGQAKFSTWMYRVAVNLCLDRLRKPRMSGLDSAPEHSDESATPEQSIEAQERAAQVRRALAELPERQRAAVTLCYFQELSNIEAAQVLDISIEALESLLSRGRRGLKAALAAAREDLLEENARGRSSGFVG